MGTKINSWFTTMHSTFYKTKTLYERHLKRFQASASRGGAIIQMPVHRPNSDIYKSVFHLAPQQDTARICC